MPLCILNILYKKYRKKSNLTVICLVLLCKRYAENNIMSNTISTHNDQQPVDYPEQKCYEKREDTKYKMENDKWRIAILFQTNFSAKANSDAKELTEWLESIKFIVIKHELRNNTSCDNDVSVILANLMKYLSLAQKSDGSQNCCFFFAFLCNKSDNIDETKLWQSLTDKQCKFSTRPKVFLLQEYNCKEVSEDGASTACPARSGNCNESTKPFVQKKQPSHINFLFIRGSGSDYISTFIRVAQKHCDLEIKDWVVRVHAHLKGGTDSWTPYYWSTLTRHLHLAYNMIVVDQEKIDQEKKEVKVVKVHFELLLSSNVQQARNHAHLTALETEFKEILQHLLSTENEDGMKDDREIVQESIRQFLDTHLYKEDLPYVESQAKLLRLAISNLNYKRS